MGEQRSEAFGGRAALSACGIALLTFFAADAARDAQADEAVYCVTCVNPDESYACTVASKGPLPADAVQLYCILRTAKKGGHASCSARRGAPGLCPGIAKRYDYEGPAPQEVLDGLAANPKVRKVRKRMEREQKSFAQPKKQESGAPSSMVEVIGNSRERMRQTRSRLLGDGEPEAADATPAPVYHAGPRQPNVHTPWETPSPVEDAPQQTAAPAETYYAPVQTQSADRPGMARRAAQSAGSAARCVWSLFRKCGSETEPTPANP